MNDRADCGQILLESLDKQFTAFFLKYTQEENNSIYATNYDLENPYTHLLKTFFSDILSFQIERNDAAKNVGGRNCHLNFIPVVLIVKDASDRGAFWKLNNPGIINGHINTADLFNEFIDRFYLVHKSKKMIEDALINLKTGEFVKFMGVDSIYDIEITSKLEVLKQGLNWKSIACKEIKMLSDLLSIQDSTVKDFGPYWPCLLDYSEQQSARAVNMFALFYVSKYAKQECDLGCNYKNPVVSEALMRLFRKLFYISLQLEKNVKYSRDHESLIATSEKEVLLRKIRNPLTQIIENLKNTGDMISYVDRQLNPPWSGILNMAHLTEIMAIYRNDKPVAYVTDDGGNDKFPGIHDLQTDYDSAAHDKHIDHVRKYFSFLIKKMDSRFVYPCFDPEADFNGNDEIVELCRDIGAKIKGLPNMVDISAIDWLNARLTEDISIITIDDGRLTDLKNAYEGIKKEGITKKSNELKGLNRIIIDEVFKRPLAQREDISVLAYKILSSQKLTANDKYGFLRFLKLITHDLQGHNKRITFLQILFYVLLSSGKTSYSVDKENNKEFALSLNLTDLMKFIDLKIYKDTIDNYRYVHDNLSNKTYPTVRLSNGVSPGEFCASLAALIGAELKGEGKDVTFRSVRIVSLGNGLHIGVTIECNGVFNVESLVRKMDEDDDINPSKMFHGMRNALRTIERAVESRRKFVDGEEKDLTECYHPFVFFSDPRAKHGVGKTIIRIILGDIYSTKGNCNYTCKDFKPASTEYLQNLLQSGA